MNLPSPHSAEPILHQDVTDTVDRAVALAQANSPPTPSTRPIPVSIPKHRIIAELGSGGMGSVYEARNSLDNPVALKIIRPDRVGEAFVVRFREEARAMQQLKHPNIPRLFDYDVIDGWPYFTMDLIRGSTLADQLESFRGETIRAVELMLKIVDAVGYLHEQGKLHRDLKPQNILIDLAGEPYLTDFGLVKEFDPNEVSSPVPEARPGASHESTVEEVATAKTKLLPRARAGLDESLTVTGAQIGTRPYMSPEQLDGRRHEVGPTTDIWALGVVFYELLAQSRPFEATTVTVLEDAIRKIEPRPPLNLDVSTNLDLNRIVHRCMAKSPSDRYGSAKDLLADMREWHAEATRARFWTRRRMVFGLAGAAALGGLGTFLLKPKPLTPLEAIQREFREKGKVILVGADRPRWSEEFGVRPEWAKNESGIWGLSSSGVAVVDLAKDLAKTPFRFSVSVKQEGETGEFLIYIGHSRFDHRRPTRHVLFGAQVLRRGSSYEAHPRIVGLTFDSLPYPRHLPRVREPVRIEPEGEWYDLEFLVSPESIVLAIEGVEVYRVARIQLQAIARQLALARNGEWDDVTPTFDLIDGFGIGVTKTTLRVRQVVVERLDRD